MLLFKLICIIIFIIITILFTVGYSNQPVITNNNEPLVLTDLSSISDISNTYKKYDNLSDNVKMALISIYYICISVTVLLSLGIICAMLKIPFCKLISKILFTLALILMIILFIILQILISSNSLTGSNKSVTNDNKLDIKTAPSISSIKNGSGYYLIVISTVLMFVNSIIYNMFA